MIVDEYGTVGYTQKEVIDYLRINPNFDLTGLFLVDGEQYEKARSETNMDDPDRTPFLPEISVWDNRSYELPVEEYHRELQKAWLMPEEYSDLNIEKYLIDKCNSEVECSRVHSELKLYEKFGLMNLLRYLKYLRDTAYKNEIVWGVGRGSSCCSYCLFLMGIHRVDSIRYNLEITEFLRG